MLLINFSPLYTLYSASLHSLLSTIFSKDSSIYLYVKCVFANFHYLCAKITINSN